MGKPGARQRAVIAGHRPSDPSLTLAEQVYHQLRSDILGGQFAPGDRLRLVELTERYGCSMTVVREGLSRLAAQGLAQSEPQHGFHVTPLSVDDLTDLTAARCEIEGLVLRLSIEHGDLAWESALVAAHHALDRTPMSGPHDDGRLTDQWTDVHSRFHAALLAACPNQRLRNIALGLRDAAELYRHWSAKGDSRNIAAEHAAMLEAALARQSDRAVEALQSHLRRTADGVLARMSHRQI